MEKIHKWFGKVYALRGVDFTVNPSEIVGLIGDNGAGKSTLIKILTGVHQPDKGEIFLKEKKVRFSSPKEARDNGIETIYQEQALADDLSVARNMFMGKELTKSIGPIRLLNIRKMKDESERICNSLSLRILSMDQEAGVCSGGERQGIAIARAMYFKAQLVVMDEPTRALGIKAVQRVLSLVQELKNMGIAVVFITHNLYHVHSVADRFVILIRGKKVYDAQKEDTSIEELTQTCLNNPDQD